MSRVSRLFRSRNDFHFDFSDLATVANTEAEIEMHFMHHGGHCCGIKVIEGLGATPSAKAGAIDAVTIHYNGYREWAGTRYYHGSRPVETYLQRLDEFLKWDTRKYGITEITLADAESYASQAKMYRAMGATNLANSYERIAKSCDQTRLWRAHLLKRGFVEVSRCYNSNSGNNIYVFHLIRDKMDEVKLEDTVLVELNAVGE